MLSSSVAVPPVFPSPSDTRSTTRNSLELSTVAKHAYLLANAGVEFRVCRLSMNAWNYTDDDFPMEVEFVPVGATELLRLQMEGYHYWRP